MNRTYQATAQCQPLAEQPSPDKKKLEWAKEHIGLLKSAYKEEWEAKLRLHRELSKAKDEWHAEVRELKDEIQALKASLLNWQDGYAALEKQFDLLQNTNKHLEAKVEELKATEDARLTYSEARCKELEREKEDLRRAYTELNEEKAKLQVRIDSNNWLECAENQRLMEENAKLRHEVMRGADANRRQHDAILELQADRGRQDAAIQGLKEKNRGLNNSLKDTLMREQTLVRELTSLKGAYAEDLIKDRVSDLMGHLGKKEAEVADLEKVIDALQTGNLSLTRETERLRKSIANLNGELGAAADEIEALLNRCDAKEHAIEDLRGTNASMKVRLDKAAEAAGGCVYASNEDFLYVGGFMFPLPPGAQSCKVVSAVIRKNLEIAIKGAV